MCRWITLLSSEKFMLSDVVLAPAHSLLRLARDATFLPNFQSMNNAAMNGDGFGLGWYHSNRTSYTERKNVISTDGGMETSTAWEDLSNDGAAVQEPDIPVYAAVYKDTQPAWNDHNLREICKATASDCVMAHVRAASPGADVTRSNAHPFKAGRLLFCHNGRVEKFQTIRRRFLSLLSDAAFNQVKGNTDSEIIFGLVLTFLEKDGQGVGDILPKNQKTPFGHSRLVHAIKKTLRVVERVKNDAGYEDGYCTCNFALTDGETMVVTRFCDKSEEGIPPPSLYFAFGDAHDLNMELTNDDSAIVAPPDTTRSDTGSDVDDDASTAVPADPEDDDDGFDEKNIVLSFKQSKPGKILTDVDPTTAAFVVASNPLTVSHTWHPLPKNSIMWCTRGKHPELHKLQKKVPNASLTRKEREVFAAVKEAGLEPVREQEQVVECVIIEHALEQALEKVAEVAMEQKQQDQEEVAATELMEQVIEHVLEQAREDSKSAAAASMDQQ